MWLAILSDQLPVIALVGHYPANKLIGREPLILRSYELSSSRDAPKRSYAVLPGRWAGYPPQVWQVAHVLRTRSPVVSCDTPVTCMC